MAIEQNKQGQSYYETIAKINQEKTDMQKALFNAQATAQSELTEKGGSAGTWQTLGKLVGPAVLDYLVGGALNLVAPGVGTAYQGLKAIPVAKAVGTAVYSGVGSKAAGKYGSDKVPVSDVQKNVRGFLEPSMYGAESSMRWDSGATEALAGQVDMQVDVLNDLIDETALWDAAKGFGSSIISDVGSEAQTYLDDVKKGGQELSSEDYLEAFKRFSSEGDKGALGNTWDFLTTPRGGADLSGITGTPDSLKRSLNISEAPPLGYDKMIADLNSTPASYSTPHYRPYQNNVLNNLMDMFSLTTNQERKN